MDDDLRLMLQEQCQQSIGRFEDTVLHSTPWTTRSILMSEGFAFCAISDLLAIDAIFESGIYNGRSTHIWANYFPFEMPIITIERRNFRKSAIVRLKPYGNVRMVMGDGPTVITQQIANLPERRIGVFLDGPKHLKAVEFAKKAFASTNVIMVAIHDMSRIRGNKASEGRIEFEKWNVEKFFTDEEWFVKKYSWLDKDESHYDGQQRLTWHPYIVIGTGAPDRKLGSYGFTVGFAFKSGKIEERI